MLLHVLVLVALMVLVEAMKKEAHGAATVEFVQGEAETEDGSGNPEDCIAVVSTGGIDLGKECCWTALWTNESGGDPSWWTVPKHLSGIATVVPSAVKRWLNSPKDEMPDVSRSNSVYVFFGFFIVIPDRIGIIFSTLLLFRLSTFFADFILFIFNFVVNIE